MESKQQSTASSSAYSRSKSSHSSSSTIATTSTPSWIKSSHRDRLFSYLASSACRLFRTNVKISNRVLNLLLTVCGSWSQTMERVKRRSEWNEKVEKEIASGGSNSSKPKAAVYFDSPQQLVDALIQEVEDEQEAEQEEWRRRQEEEEERVRKEKDKNRETEEKKAGGGGNEIVIIPASAAAATPIINPLLSTSSTSSSSLILPLPLPTQSWITSQDRDTLFSYLSSPSQCTLFRSINLKLTNRTLDLYLLECGSTLETIVFMKMLDARGNCYQSTAALLEAIKQLKEARRKKIEEIQMRQGAGTNTGSPTYLSSQSSSSALGLEAIREVATAASSPALASRTNVAANGTPVQLTNMPDLPSSQSLSSGIASTKPSPRGDGSSSTTTPPTWSTSDRDTLFTYLASPSCLLFSVNIKLSNKALDSLLTSGGTVEKTVGICQDLNQKGLQYQSVQNLCEGVMVRREEMDGGEGDESKTDEPTSTDPSAAINPSPLDLSTQTAGSVVLNKFTRPDIVLSITPSDRDSLFALLSDPSTQLFSMDVKLNNKSLDRMLVAGTTLDLTLMYCREFHHSSLQFTCVDDLCSAIDSTHSAAAQHKDELLDTLQTWMCHLFSKEWRERMARGKEGKGKGKGKNGGGDKSNVNTARNGNGSTTDRTTSDTTTATSESSLQITPAMIDELYATGKSGLYTLSHIERLRSLNEQSSSIQELGMKVYELDCTMNELHREDTRGVEAYLLSPEGKLFFHPPDDEETGLPYVLTPVDYIHIASAGRQSLYAPSRSVEYMHQLSEQGFSYDMIEDLLTKLYESISNPNSPRSYNQKEKGETSRNYLDDENDLDIYIDPDNPTNSTGEPHHHELKDIIKYDQEYKSILITQAHKGDVRVSSTVSIPVPSLPPLPEKAEQKRRAQAKKRIQKEVGENESRLAAYKTPLKSYLILSLSCTNLPPITGHSNCDSWLEFFRYRAYQDQISSDIWTEQVKKNQWQRVYKTEQVKNTCSPVFHTCIWSIETLCASEYDRPVCIKVMQWNKGQQCSEEVGEVITTLREMIAHAHAGDDGVKEDNDGDRRVYKIINETEGRKNGGDSSSTSSSSSSATTTSAYTNSGLLHILKCEIKIPRSIVAIRTIVSAVQNKVEIVLRADGTEETEYKRMLYAPDEKLRQVGNLAGIGVGQYVYSECQVWFTIRGEKLEKLGTFGQTSSLLQIYRVNPTIVLNKNGTYATTPVTAVTSSDYVKVYESEIIERNLNPEFRSFLISMKDLCTGNVFTPLILRVYDHNRNRANDLIGEFQCDLYALLTKGVHEDNKYSLINPIKLGKAAYRNSGILTIRCKLLSKYDITVNDSKLCEELVLRAPFLLGWQPGLELKSLQHGGTAGKEAAAAEKVVKDGAAAVAASSSSTTATGATTTRDKDKPASTATPPTTTTTSGGGILKSAMKSARKLSIEPRQSMK